MRPQFGSLAVDRGLDQAARDDGAGDGPRVGVVARRRSPTAVMRIVAPSPSAACWRARSRATASIAAPNATAAVTAGGRPVRRAAAPDARTKTVSLVLVSPSTDSWSQVRAAAGRSRLHRTSGATAASVSTTDSIVAMFGWIIPTPLAMPVTVTVTGSPSAAGSSTRRRRDLGHGVGRAQGLGGGREAGVVTAQRRNTALPSPASTCRAAVGSR